MRLRTERKVRDVVMAAMSSTAASGWQFEAEQAAVEGLINLIDDLALNTLSEKGGGSVGDLRAALTTAGWRFSSLARLMRKETATAALAPSLDEAADDIKAALSKTSPADEGA